MFDLSLLAQSAAPVMDGAYFIQLLSRVFHTTCGATLLGGTIYLRFVLAPTAVASDDPEAACFASRRKAWAGCVGICTLLLLVSGFYNFTVIIGANEKLPGQYHMLFGIKFLLALVVMTLCALIAGRTSLAKKLRGNLKLWLNVCLIAALAVFVLGAMLRAVPKIPKAAQVVPIENNDVANNDVATEENN